MLNLCPNFYKTIRPSQHLLLEFNFTFASEHCVITMKQRPRDWFLKISRDNLLDGKNEEWQSAEPRFIYTEIENFMEVLVAACSRFRGEEQGARNHFELLGSAV